MKFEHIFFSFNRDMCVTTDFSIKDAYYADHGFLPVSFVPMCTLSDCKSDMALLEYIYSYLEALQVLAGQAMYDYQTLKLANGEVKIAGLSFNLPGVYLSCHVVELVLKYTMQRVFHDSLQNVHDLKWLWSLFRERLVDVLDEPSQHILPQLDDFMDMMSSFSRKHNTRFRYAVDGDGSICQTTMEYVDLCVLVRSVELFVQQLFSLDAPLLSEPKLDARLKIFGCDGSYMEKWTFGFDVMGRCIGAHLCDGLMKLGYLKCHRLQLSQFSESGGRTYKKIEFVNTSLFLPESAGVSRLCDYKMDTLVAFCGSGHSGSWMLEAEYKGVTVYFSGSCYGTRIGVSYVSKNVLRFRPVMKDLYKYLQTVFVDVSDGDAVL